MIQTDWKIPPFRVPNRREQMLLDLIQVLGVLLGVAAIADLHERVKWFWVIGTGAGVLLTVTGIAYAYILYRRTEQRLFYLSPALVAISGFLCIPPSLLALLLHTQRVTNTGWVALFFSTPVLVIWLVAQVYHLYELVSIRPKRTLEILGMTSAGCQILASILFLVSFGLEIGMLTVPWLLWMPLALAFTGAGLAVATWRQSVAQPAKR